MEVEKAKNWLSRHGDTLAIIGTICCGFLWADHKIDALASRIHHLEMKVSNIKTILILKGVYPKDLLGQDLHGKGG